MLSPECKNADYIDNVQGKAHTLGKVVVHSKMEVTQEKLLLNKLCYFVFFAHKKYSRSFVDWSWATDVTWTVL